MNAIPPDIAAAIARIPMLARVPAAEMAIEPLPALTNRNYKVTSRQQSYVLRMPGAGTEKYIDREAESHDAALAATAGLTPEIVFADPATGLMLTRFVDGAETLTAAAMHDPGTMAEAAQILRRLHDSGLVFRREMRLFDKIDSYLQKSPRAAAQFGEVRRAAERLRDLIDGPGRRLVPCHIDPTPSNFIRGRGPDGALRMYLIDWEYAEMSEPAYDLAGLSIEAEFNEAEDAALLAAYGEGVRGATPDRFAAYKSMLYLMAGSWAAMAVELGNALPDLEAMAMKRLEQGRTALAAAVAKETQTVSRTPAALRGYDVVWMAVDEAGHVGAFMTAGEGPVPATAMSAAVDVFDIENQLHLLLPITSFQQAMPSGNAPSFVSLAERGLFVFDWCDVHRKTAEERHVYELINAPDVPLSVESLPPNLRAVARATHLKGILFKDSRQSGVKI